MNAGMTASYVIAILCGLLSAYAINIFSPNLAPIIKFIILPFLVIYVVLIILRFIIPGLNKFGRRFRNYVDDKAQNDINSMSYVEIFPPIFAVFVIIIILLYSGWF